MSRGGDVLLRFPFLPNYQCLFMKDKMYYMLLIACCLCSVSAMAQNRSSISGTVYDRKSGLPIPYATVFIGHKGTGTDGKGRYELKGVSRNLTLLNVSCVGYEKAVQPVLPKIGRASCRERV